MADVLRVLFLAAEADPFIKIGGLGDVAGSLPRALLTVAQELDYPIDVRLVIPFHGAIQRQNYPLRPIAKFDISSSLGPFSAEALTMDFDGLPVYFIAGTPIPPDAPVYTSNPGLDGRKFVFFSLAALEMARTLGWPPHIVHANDWHTAPAIYALGLRRDHDPFYYHTTTLLGLHNLPYLSVGAGEALSEFGLPPATGSPLPEWAQNMPLPLGLLAADHIVAASPHYAKEIMTPEFGSGLDAFLRKRADAISGILNGIDQNRWDPRTDPALPRCFDEERLDQRLENKAALQAELGLEINPGVPLLSMVTRLDYQKGVDLAFTALRLLDDRPWQAVFLGTGDPKLEEAARELADAYPDRVRTAIRFDIALSRHIYGGADMILIPSRYEPCGLTQMIGMRYGCVPVARATGGLSDTIDDFTRSADSTGFLFKKASPLALAGALRRALDAYTQPDVWQGLQVRGMLRDFSWNRFARQYLDLYQFMVEGRQFEQQK